MSVIGLLVVLVVVGALLILGLWVLQIFELARGYLALRMVQADHERQLAALQAAYDDMRAAYLRVCQDREDGIQRDPVVEARVQAFLLRMNAKLAEPVR